MKTHDKIDDVRISELVRSVRIKIPDVVENNLAEKRYKRKTERIRLLRWPIIWYPVSAALTIGFLLTILFLNPGVKNTLEQPKEQISEIKTEFELKDKKIKILWIQRNDFKLRRNKL